jgi:ATP synthase protein I
MRHPWIAALSLFGVGFYVAGAIILGVIGGRWLDNKYGTGSLWVIIGLIVGLFVAVYGSYLMLKPFLQNYWKDKGNK